MCLFRTERIGHCPDITSSFAIHIAGDAEMQPTNGIMPIVAEAAISPLCRECQEPVMVTQPDDTILVGCKMRAMPGESHNAPDIPDVKVQGTEQDHIITTHSKPSSQRHAE